MQQQLCRAFEISQCLHFYDGGLQAYRQRVTHPSVAQSNRKSSEESFLSASLDLHVLSTPPAFILSQDQTLVKSVCIQFRINILANSSLFTVVWFLTVRSTASSSKLRFSLSWLRQYSQASLSESKLSKLLLCSCSLRFSKIFS